MIDNDDVHLSLLLLQFKSELRLDSGENRRLSFQIGRTR
jgi:hypothetical protein